jgi:hypothetical protein
MFFPNSNPKRKSTMTQLAANPSSINNSARCIHLYPNGRRCRLNGNPNFCPAHAPLSIHQHDPAEIASTLTANLNDFTSASQINDFLSRLLLLLAQDKISTRRAATLAYITNQLLRTLPAIAKEGSADPEIIWDLPGPDRDMIDANPSRPAAAPDYQPVPA